MATGPQADQRPLTEASQVTLTAMTLSTGSALCCVDPATRDLAQQVRVGAAREVLCTPGIMGAHPDLCFYRKPEDAAEQGKAAAQKAVTRQGLQRDGLLQLLTRLPQPQVSRWQAPSPLSSISHCRLEHPGRH